MFTTKNTALLHFVCKSAVWKKPENMLQYHHKSAFEYDLEVDIMSIGTTIKKLRRERDMTQEQLAEYLGITANAVSQWECDRTAPDISQLPMLANIFRVSADVILGIDVNAKDTQIEEIYNEARELFCTGHLEQANDLCREGLKKFPDAYILMKELAFNLSYSKNRAQQEESIALFERILAGPTDDSAKNVAIGNLCRLYMAVGKPEVAKELAETISDPIYTKAQCRRMTLRGEEWADDMRNQVAIDFDNFIWGLRNLMSAFKDNHPIFTDEELLLLWQKIICLVDVFYENGDYAFHEQILMQAHFRRAKLYLKSGNPETALDELENMRRHIESFERYSDGLLGKLVILPPDKWPTSLLVRPRDENDSRIAMQVSSPSTENAAMEYLRSLSDSAFDAIRGHERFCELEEQLKKTARE